MNVFFTSDLHLGHINIIPLCDRPFEDVDEMDEALIRNWNEDVGQDDVVWVLGDAAMGRFVDSMALVRRLNGRKILIPGNHDRISPAYPDQRPHKVREARMLYRQAFFDIYPTGLTLSLDGSYAQSTVRLAHYPYVSDGDEGRPELDAYRPTDDGTALLHGHVHTLWTTNGRQFNVGVDVHGFRPVPFETVREWYQNLT